jgi:hypothetical protein
MPTGLSALGLQINRQQPGTVRLYHDQNTYNTLLGYMQGSAADKAVRRVAQAVAVAWGDTMVRDVNGAVSGSDALRISVRKDGSLAAGFVSLERARTLFETRSRIEALLRTAAEGGAGARPGAQTRSRLKNVNLIDVKVS